MRRLATLSTQKILALLTDETLFQLGAQYLQFEATTQADDASAVEVAETSPAAQLGQLVKENEKAKRPLNAFMAFRSYYLKIFPDVQQKTASGFLTTLWHKDPFRNKWALIAKVYSFVRDEIGKENVSLAYFLSIASPVMKVPHPSTYLQLLGWSVQVDGAGLQGLVQNEIPGAIDQFISESSDFPSTEVELLSTIVQVGFDCDQGVDLLERMSTNQNGIMATRGMKYTLPVSYTKEKIKFMQMVRSDPAKAAKEIIGENQAVSFSGITSYNVHDMDSIGHLPLQRKYQDPLDSYNYASNLSGIDLDANGPVLNFNALPENETFDISSPYDVDEMLGYSQMEGDRTAQLGASQPYNQLEDFHYLF
ncbi:MAT1-1-1 [Ophiocordyceps camponoti-floridani]|uniref:MAT1-1-1 n=1 Tax=Ophiocordyceps camponoti-floridani TaxID=2030778 RepID=A0A8H4Q2L2_9HYPO|nr:MAT1-1-1 [Ophiocordyceps camponoti-floridani]